MSKSDKTDRIVQQILHLLNHQYQNQRRKQLLVIVFASMSVLFISLGIFFTLENALYLSAIVKSTVIFLLFFVVLSIAINIIHKSEQVSFNEFYEKLLLSYNYEDVLNAVDLYENMEDQSSIFRAAAIHENLKGINTDKLSEDISQFGTRSHIHRTYKKYLWLFLSSFLLFLLTIIVYPSDALRTAHFWKNYAQPNPFTFAITPADTTIEHGADLQITANFHDDLHPNQVVLLFKTDIEEEFRRRNMDAIDNNQFISPSINLTNTISYRVEMDQFLSKEYTADVRIQPGFETLQATISSPSYTGIPERTVEYPYPELRMYKGSTLFFNGTTNKPVQSVFLNSSTVDSLELQLSDGSSSYSAELQPQRTDTLSFKITDSDQLLNRNPFKTFVTIQDDQPPTVTVHEPTEPITEPDPKQLRIFFEANDDFGISKAEMRWELTRAFTDSPEIRSIEIPTPRNGPTEQFTQELNEFQLRPRDNLSFIIRVWDNDEFSGYKYGDSRNITIQVPSLAEYFDELEDREQTVEQDLDEVSNQFETMEQEYQEFLERLRENPDSGFEEEQMVENIQEQQEQIEDAVQNLNERFQDLRSEIENNDHISEETKRSYQELQQLMDELDDPTLREAMEELQRAMESLSPQELERAMEEVDFNEQLYKERIERTLELFKRLKMNSNLDKLASQYEDMADRMNRTEEDDAPTSEKLNEIDTISEDLNTTEKQIENLDNDPPARSEQKLRDLKEESKQGLENIRKELNDLKNNIQASENNDQTGNDSSEDPSEEQEPEPGEDSNQQQQKQISEMMKQEAERFRDSAQQMSGQQMQVNILALQRALYTLLELSNQQELLTQTANDIRNRSQGFIELARIQKNISDQFSFVSDTLFKVSSELPGVPNQINQKKLNVERTLSNSMDEMVERNQRQTSIATRESLGGINDLSSMIATLIDQLMNQQNGGMGSGMSMQQMVEQLQNMSGDQQQLNQQLQNLINDAQGDRLTQEQSERIDQIARQQNEIRKQLQEIQQSGALDHGDKLLSELQRMMEDMEESINDMRGGVTDPLMVQRQQNILSRMLNAEESLQQRGEDDEREGNTASEFDRSLPPEMTLEDLEQEIRDRMRDPNYTRFSEEYRQLIELYFEQLRRMESPSLP